jgi:hypothetical protein
MHRHRVWNTSSPLLRTERNRILNIDGFIPAVDTLYFSPIDPIYNVNSPGIQEIKPSFYFSYLEEPVQFKYSAVRKPQDVNIYWTKNNGEFVLWPIGTFNGANFRTGDTLTIGISVYDADPGSDFSFTLFNSLDTAACSNTITILTSDLIIGPPEFP